ncbi:major capsid protein [Blackfly microvirus SF02]|uniref:Major capsid protein n=1 Tax=Blackfly microvirus SF02 TaxID=2576452 RepID=A0A4V1F5G5_9VIRU|nr:major capsid protein [Blackfly microvirus SF02]
MQVRDMKQKSVGIHDFAMNPRADVMRSSFPVRQGKKVAFSASYLVPIYCEEVLPGDTFNITCDTVARTAVPIVPVLDNWHMEFFAFFTPNRLVWTNWMKMLGAQDNPADSIAFTVPVSTSAVGGYGIGGIHDYFGLPTAGQITAGLTYNHQTLPLRMYNKIYNEWFRDQNLQNSLPNNTGNGPDNPGDYVLTKRGKRHDYFTACLPWPQKGTAVTLPLGTTAPITSTGLAIALDNSTFNRTGTGINLTSGTNVPTWSNSTAVPSSVANFGVAGATVQALQANLSGAAGPTVNLFRQYFQTQKFMERQARGGTRYTELIQSHFGVRPPDYRLDRPEYIGGGKIPILTNAIPQTSATGLTGGTTPAGNLAATGYANGRVGFNYSSQEHGYIIMLANVRADLTYQQGLRRHWSRQTIYDFYFPVFAMLGEQTVLNREIYSDGSAADNTTFGYIPRWDEYRHFPTEIAGIFRSTAAGTIDYWHSSQRFTTLPSLNTTFITDDTNTVLQRNFAAGAATQGQQFLCDFMFTGRVARPLPMNSVPGMIDHF